MSVFQIIHENLCERLSSITKRGEIESPGGLGNPGLVLLAIDEP